MSITITCLKEYEIYDEDQECIGRIIHDYDKEEWTFIRDDNNNSWMYEAELILITEKIKELNMEEY